MGDLGWRSPKLIGKTWLRIVAQEQVNEALGAPPGCNRERRVAADRLVINVGAVEEQAADALVLVTIARRRIDGEMEGSLAGRVGEGEGDGVG